MSASDKDAGEERSTVILTLPDGERRELSATAEDLNDLTARSTPLVDSRRSIVRQILRPAAFISGAIVTLLLVPAITQQWGDRPKDAEVKADIVKELSEASAVAISNVRFLSAGATPEAVAVDRACSRKPDASRRDRARCDEAVEKESTATATTTRATRTEWRRRAASVEGQVAAYFPAASQQELVAYTAAIERFLSLYTTCTERTVEVVQELLAYIELPGRDPTLNALYLSPGERGCRNFAKRSGEHAEAIDLLNTELLNRRQDLATSLVAADTGGFSTTLEDLWGDIWWIVIVGLACAVAYLLAVIWLERDP